MGLDATMSEDSKNIISTGIEALGDVAKAEQETQKTAQKAMELAAQAGKFLGKIFEPAAVELGQTLGDQMKYWRFKNLGHVDKLLTQRRAATI